MVGAMLIINMHNANPPFIGFCVLESIMIDIDKIVTFFFYSKKTRNLEGIAEIQCLLEMKTNENSFERNTLFHGGKLWNAQTMASRNITTHKNFNNDEKCRLNAMLPY